MERRQAEQFLWDFSKMNKTQSHKPGPPVDNKSSSIHILDTNAQVSQHAKITIWNSAASSL